MKRISCFAIAVLCATVTFAQDSVWVVRGRAVEVLVEHRQFHPLRTHVVLAYPGAEVEGLCGDSSTTCAALGGSNGCSWASLPSATRDVLLAVVGGAWCGPAQHPVCTATVGILPGPEIYSSEAWACEGGAPAAQCSEMGGHLNPLLAIDYLVPSSGCTL